LYRNSRKIASNSPYVKNRNNRSSNQLQSNDENDNTFSNSSNGGGNVGDIVVRGDILNVNSIPGSPSPNGSAINPSNVNDSNFSNSEDKLNDNHVENYTQQVENEVANSPSQSAEQLIREWAIDNQITHVAINGILQIIKLKYDSTLPADARTLLRTPIDQCKNIKKICGGEYYHFGLISSLDYLLNKIRTENESLYINILQEGNLFMKINSDGIPLHRSTNRQFWPLLVEFNYGTFSNSLLSNSVMVVGIFYGNSKPNNLNDYLKDLIEELQILSSGYTFKGHVLKVNLSFFVCDAPARQFLKCITSHNAYRGCERCCQRGKFEKTVTFPKTDCKRRTDKDFLMQTDEDHHKDKSPLADLGNIGMVTQFVLDPMHLVFLGVARKLIFLWIKGPLNVRIGTQKKKLISQHLISIKNCIPCEINRLPRSLDEIEKYKATEYRTFLLYTGMVVLAEVLDKNLYKNFLLLCVSIHLLSRDDIPLSTMQAENYLIAFIKHFGKIYGTNNLVYNVHNLCHLADDVRRFGTLDKISAFCFESKLGSIKRLLRKPYQSLIQVVNRLLEQKSLVTDGYFSIVNFPKLLKQHTNGPLLTEESCTQYKEIRLEKFTLKLNKGDNVFLIDNKIAIVKNIIKDSETNAINILYVTFNSQENFFHYPLASSKIGIFKVSSLSKQLKSVKLSHIKVKYILISCSNSNVAIPLLHTLHQQ